MKLVFQCFSDGSEKESSWKKKDEERKKEIERKLKEDEERCDMFLFRFFLSVLFYFK